jgi:hypothetical protein
MYKPMGNLFSDDAAEEEAGPRRRGRKKIVDRMEQAPPPGGKEEEDPDGFSSDDLAREREENEHLAFLDANPDLTLSELKRLNGVYNAMASNIVNFIDQKTGQERDWGTTTEINNIFKRAEEDATRMRELSRMYRKLEDIKVQGDQFVPYRIRTIISRKKLEELEERERNENFLRYVRNEVPRAKLRIKTATSAIQKNTEILQQKDIPEKERNTALKKIKDAEERIAKDTELIDILQLNVDVEVKRKKLKENNFEISPNAR